MNSTTWHNTAEMSRIWIRINGTSNAWPRRLGCGCRRCTYWSSFRGTQPNGFVAFDGIRHPRSPARTSVSLFIEVDGRAVEHILFDCGPGVAESLVLGRFAGIEHCTRLFVTHNHPDHLDPNALIETLRRAAGNSKSSFQLLTYGSEFVERTLNEKYPYERKYIDFKTVSPGTPVEDSPRVRVTPISVAHGRCRGAHSYVVDVLNRRIVVAFDLDLPDVPTTSGRTNLQVFEDVSERGELNDVDLLILDGNTFRARGTGHNTIVDSATYIDVIRPRQTMFVHYSGHEDLKGDGHGWLDDKVEVMAQRLHGTSVCVPAEGRMLTL